MKVILLNIKTCNVIHIANANKPIIRHRKITSLIKIHDDTFNCLQTILIRTKTRTNVLTNVTENAYAADNPQIKQMYATGRTNNRITPKNIESFFISPVAIAQVESELANVFKIAVAIVHLINITVNSGTCFSHILKMYGASMHIGNPNIIKR